MSTSKSGRPSGVAPDRNCITNPITPLALNNLPEFECIEFGIPDIVRSGLLKSYLIEKIRQGKHYE